MKKRINNLDYTFTFWSPDKSKTHRSARIYIIQHFAPGQDRKFGFYNIHNQEYTPEKVYGSTRDFIGSDDGMWTVLEQIAEEI